MSFTFGSIGPFDPKYNDWRTYEGQLQFFLKANKVDDKKLQRATPISDRRY